MTETWRDVEGYPGYRISDRGAVVRLRRGEWLPKSISFPGNGYARVQFSRNKVAKTFLLHRLVMKHFGTPQPSEDHQVAHNDGDKRNNAISNLRWATPTENAADRKLHGTHYVGTKTNSAKLTERDVRIIHALYGEGWSSYRVAELFGVDPTTVQRAVKGKHWNETAWRRLRDAPAETRDGGSP